MNYRIDLILGEAICIFIRRIFFHFPDSGLSVLTGSLFIFDGIAVKTQEIFGVDKFDADQHLG